MGLTGVTGLGSVTSAGFGVVAAGLAAVDGIGLTGVVGSNGTDGFDVAGGGCVVTSGFT